MALRWQRPTVDTKFHIDMGWWQANDRDIRIYMRDVLCDECKTLYAESYRDSDKVDWVDGQTGEVSRVDGLWHCFRSCCGLKPGYISPSTPIIDAIFLTFLANGNEPLSIVELYERLDRRPPATLLRILTAAKVYMGLRPLH